VAGGATLLEANPAVLPVAPLVRPSKVDNPGATLC
jgi:hypothetical protein